MKNPRQLAEMGLVLPITIHEDDTVAPRYETGWTQLGPSKAIITKQGTASGFPLVDFQLEDHMGRKFYFMISGRLLASFASMINGVIEENQTTPPPVPN